MAGDSKTRLFVEEEEGTPVAAFFTPDEPQGEKGGGGEKEKSRASQGMLIAGKRNRRQDVYFLLVTKGRLLSEGEGDLGGREGRSGL